MNESPLSEALKAVSRPKRPKATIRVCGCGTPLIFTLCWAYRERYCLNCSEGGGMLGTGEDVEATRELKFTKKLIDSIWGVLYGNKGLLPRSRYTLDNCKKCKSQGDHNAHLSAAEKEWDAIATKYLYQFKGVFSLEGGNDKN